MKLGISRIFRYIAKIFFVRFILILFGFGLLFFIINFIENSDKFNGDDEPTSIVLLMALLHSPRFLNGVIIPMTLLSGILTTHSLSTKSELIVMRSSGLSVWTLIKPIVFSALALGFFWILAFDPTSIVSDKYFFKLDKKFVKIEQRETIEPSFGIWLRQNNQENFVGKFHPFSHTSLDDRQSAESVFDIKNNLKSLIEDTDKADISKENNDEKYGNVIIYAKKIYPESFSFGDITFWFLDKNKNFYKKIDGKYAELDNGWWMVDFAILNDNRNVNVEKKNIRISSDLDREFVRQKIRDDFKLPELYSIYILPRLMREMSESGLDNSKFRVRFHSLLALPIVMVAVAVMGAFFGINHFRSGRANIMIFFGIVCGLLIYILLSIINALGSSSFLSIFASTWVIAFLFLAISILTISSKEII